MISDDRQWLIFIPFQPAANLTHAGLRPGKYHVTAPRIRLMMPLWVAHEEPPTGFFSLFCFFSRQIQA